MYNLLITHTHTHTHAQTQSHARARAHTHTRARAHTHTHTRTHARTHTHTHTTIIVLTPPKFQELHAVFGFGVVPAVLQFVPLEPVHRLLQLIDVVACSSSLKLLP